MVALPESRNEVETIATDLPRPGTILLGDHATETDFKRLPLNQYNVTQLPIFVAWLLRSPFLIEVAVETIISDRPPHRSARALISACGSYLG